MTFQYRVEWSGTTGGAGVSVINARLSGAALTTGPQQFADNVRVFFDAVKAYIPNEVTLTFADEVTELDTALGQVTNFHPVTSPLSVAGTSSTGYAHASGVRVDWHTASVLNGRRLKGRTYLVPITGSAFDSTGRVSATPAGVIETAAQALIDGMENIGSLAVWSRTHGVLADVTGGTVDPLGAVLRSRRD